MRKAISACYDSHVTLYVVTVDDCWLDRSWISAQPDFFPFYFSSTLALKWSLMLSGWKAEGGEVEVGQREQRGSLLIIHPSPVTDRSQHAALWASAPAYREKKEGGRETVVGW